MKLISENVEFLITSDMKKPSKHLELGLDN